MLVVEWNTDGIGRGGIRSEGPDLWGRDQVRESELPKTCLYNIDFLSSHPLR